MIKIATHNSSTGERGEGVLSLLLTPFAVTQSKTIGEQYDAGVRYFDIRMKIRDGLWVLAHGGWHSAVTPREVFAFLNEKGGAIVSVTYEGRLDNEEWFMDYCKFLMDIYPNITWHTINVKKPKWRCLKTITEVGLEGKYVKLDMHSWHSLIPIPWLWDRVYNRPHKYNETFFVSYDFV